MELGENLDDRSRPNPGELVAQAARGLPRLDRHRMPDDDRPGVQPLVHAHDRDAGFPIAGKQGALDGRGAAPAGKQ